jgi:hypothetical protein
VSSAWNALFSVFLANTAVLHALADFGACQYTLWLEIFGRETVWETLLY